MRTSSQILRAMSSTVSLSDLANRIEEALNGNVSRPWCVHRLYETLLSQGESRTRDSLLEITQHAADELVAAGRARREYVSAIAIGVHCEDALYWPARSPELRLSDFGPEFESPAILHRLASHFQCHGL